RLERRQHPERNRTEWFDCHAVFTTTGLFNIAVTASDSVGDVSQPGFAGVQISTAALDTASIDPTQIALLGGVTSGADTLAIPATKTAGALQVTVNGADAGTWTPTGHVIVYGQDGNDAIQRARLGNGNGNQVVYVSATAILFGEGGNNVLDA